MKTGDGVVAAAGLRSLWGGLFAFCCLALIGCSPMPKPARVRSEVVPGWSVVACPLADRDASERFEAVRLLDDFGHGLEGWTAGAGGQNAKAALALDTAERRTSSASLRVDYEFVGKSDYEYVEFGKHVAVEGPGLGVGFWVKGGESRSTLRLRIRDKSGEVLGAV